MRTCYQKFTNYCRSCYKGFNDTRQFAQHMSFLQSFLVSVHQCKPTRTPAKIAFIFKPQSYHLPPLTTQTNTDLAEFLLQHKPEKDWLTEQKLSQGSQRVEVFYHSQSAKRVKTKIRKTRFYAKSLLTSVYGQRLSSGTFWTMVEEMLIVLTKINSSGSGWAPEKVVKVILIFFRNPSITSLSYIALPSQIHNLQFGLQAVYNLQP